MAKKRFPIIPVLAVAAGALCGAAPVVAQGKAPRGETAQVRVMHCSDVVCSPAGDGAARGALALSARYPQMAGTMLRVVVVDQMDKRVSLIDMRSDVGADGE